MIKFCRDRWDQNKGLLEQHLRTDTTLNSCEYKDLVELVVKYILNGGEKPQTFVNHLWDYENIVTIDHGEYQGTILFLIPMCAYQPAEYEYLMTFVGYGSCSGCDTLQAIQDYRDELLSDKQVKEFMTLCKDLVCNMIKPYNSGWRHLSDFEKDFETVEVEE